MSTQFEQYIFTENSPYQTGDLALSIYYDANSGLTGYDSTPVVFVGEIQADGFIRTTGYKALLTGSNVGDVSGTKGPQMVFLLSTDEPMDLNFTVTGGLYSNFNKDMV